MKNNDQDVEVVESMEPLPNVPYTIYTKKQKIAIILAASIASFFSPMSSNIYVPALNSVARDMKVSNSLINLTLTSYLVSLWNHLRQSGISLHSPHRFFKVLLQHL
jgi:hypothetical protein